MKKYLSLIAAFIACALLIIFVAGGAVHDYRTLGADLLASTGFQSATSSAQNAASSLSAASTSAPILTDVLRQLQDRVQSLGNQMADFRSELEIIKLKTVFTRILRRGNSGNDVIKLQEVLAKIAEISDSETVSLSTATGYYGSGTEIAVRQFQAQQKLKQTGIFDVSTRELFFQFITDHMTQEGTGTTTEFVPIDLSSVSDFSGAKDLQNKTAPQAPDSATKISTPDAQTSTSSDAVSQTSPLTSRVSSVETSMADLQNQISQLASNLASVQANQGTSALSITPTPTPTPVPAPAPAPSPVATSTAPKLAISNIQATSITKASSTIIWLTNTPSTSEVDYSANSAIPANQMAMVSNSTMTTSHKTVLQNLSANTKYYYRVVSKDAAGIVASSTIQFFTTLP